MDWYIGDNIMNLSKSLKQLRQKAGLTLHKLQEKTGIHNSLISQMETGYVKEPSFNKVCKVLNACGIEWVNISDPDQPKFFSSESDGNDARTP